MSIFPKDYNEAIKYQSKSDDISLLKEYAIDFETGEILIDDNGKFTIVDGLEAIKVRVYLELLIKRGRWFIYPNVGTNIDTLKGKDLSYANSNTEQILRDGLIDGVYITDITDINITLDKDVGRIEFTVVSIYGNYDEIYEEEV